jgi:hypothetical protein
MGYKILNGSKEPKNSLAIVLPYSYRKNKREIKNVIMKNKLKTRE